MKIFQKELTPFELHVMEKKGTERPGSGEYNLTVEDGLYHCKNCGACLFSSQDKFLSHCGWPSFDRSQKGAVDRVPDADGRRVEIICHQCGAHLGHVFTGEKLTPLDTRYCVNSISLTFAPDKIEKAATVVLASGCFWGTEYFFARAPGVLKTEVGYSGGHVNNPTYEEVCKGATGHLECVEVTYNPAKTSLLKLLHLFFETHDFSQVNGQGPDIGPQYLSAIFYNSPEEFELARGVMRELEERGYTVATQLKSRTQFYPAESYHQKYYFRHAKTPYCHIYRPIF